MLHFEIRKFSKLDDFLLAIANKMKFSIKKNIADVDRAARYVIDCVIKGELNYETNPTK